MTITFKRDGATMLTPCPNDVGSPMGRVMVNSVNCAACRHFHGEAGPDSINCNYHLPSAPCSVLIEGKDACRKALAVIDKVMRKV